MSEHDDGGSDDGDGKVGYGRPPKAHQFKPGQSGNRKGRPKSSKGMRTLFIQELRKKITVTEGGKTRSISRAEAIVLQSIRKALNGDPKLLALLLGIDREHYPTDLHIGGGAPRTELDEVEAAEMAALINRLRNSGADPSSRAEPTGGVSDAAAEYSGIADGDKP